MLRQVLKYISVFAVLCLLLAFYGGLSVSADGFSDVGYGDWYYDDVTLLTNAGIIGGYGDGCFYPERSMSCAEFTKVLVGCVGTNETVTDTTPLFEGHWASECISRAYALGIITDEDLAAGFSPDLPITRLQMTKMAVLALGLEPAHIESPFVDSTDPYAVAAYRAYLLRGYKHPDGRRYASGMTVATRAEAAAVAVRILEYQSDPYEYKKNAILENAEQNYLDTQAELMDLFYVLNRELFTEYTFMTHLPFEEWSALYADTKLLHFEYFYSDGCTCNYIPGNNMYAVKLTYSEAVSEIRRRHDETEATADAVISQIITVGMSELDKLQAIHDYIVLNCAYDYARLQNGTVPKESYLAYGALCKKTAVCQGYTNAFSLLCKRVGVPAITVVGAAPDSGAAHSWNLVLVDGVIYGIDVTFDDPVPDVDGRVERTYFMMTLDEMEHFGYSWDASKIKLEYFH